MFKLDLEKAEESEIKLATSVESSKKQQFQKNIYLCGSQQWKTSRDGNTRPPDLPPEKSICRLRSNRTGHGTTDWFQIGKGVRQDCILSPCVFHLYAEYIIRNAGLDEAQDEIKIVRRNKNNFRYADDTTLMAESEEELKSLLMKVKEESEKAGLKLNIQKTNIMASDPISSWQTEEKQWKQGQTLFQGAPKSLQMVTTAMKLKDLLLGRKVMTNLDSILKSRDITLPTNVHLVKTTGFSSGHVWM